VLDEGFKILSSDVFNALAETLAKGKEQGSRRKGTGKRPRFVVQTPLVAHVPVKMIRILEVHMREPLKDTVDKTLLMGFLMVALCGLMGNWICQGHFSSFFVRKNRIDNDLQTVLWSILFVTYR